jgi:hypothetical protein
MQLLRNFLMMRDIFTFHFLDMRTTISLSALVGSLLLIVIFTVAALFLTELTLLNAVIAAIGATLIHWFSETIHQYGHFWAAKRVGYPARGMKLWAVLGTTRYPKDEPELAAQTHIRRAIGGPIMSAVVSLVCVILALLFWSNAGIVRFLLGFAVFGNIGIFTIGPFLLPVRTKYLETDGGTILYWMRQSDAPHK